MNNHNILYAIEIDIICDNFSNHKSLNIINDLIYDYYNIEICHKCFQESIGLTLFSRHKTIICQSCYELRKSFLQHNLVSLIRAAKQYYFRNYAKQNYIKNHLLNYPKRKKMFKQIDLKTQANKRLAVTIDNKLLNLLHNEKGIQKQVYKYLSPEGNKLFIKCRMCNKYGVTMYSHLCEECKYMQFRYHSLVIDLKYDIFVHPDYCTIRSVSLRNYFYRIHNYLPLPPRWYTIDNNTVILTDVSDLVSTDSDLPTEYWYDTNEALTPISSELEYNITQP